MIAARLSEVAAAIGARRTGKDASFVGVSTDSRALTRGSLFVALAGSRHDGHEYAEAARARGAAALLVSRELMLNLPQLVVPDTERALGQLARWWRAGLSAKVVGITGSNGKTTVRALTQAVLSEAGTTSGTLGNFNNEIGLPLTVLGLGRECRYAVLEMGAGKPGDIGYLAHIAMPHVALVNNVGPAHLERLGTIEGVAAAKGEIYDGLAADGIGVVNADDAFADSFHAMLGARRRVDFGMGKGVQVTAEQMELGSPTRFMLATPLGRAAVSLPLQGQHNVMNALAAAAIGHALGLAPAAIARGLSLVAPVAGRLTRYESAEGWSLLDDSYNANPASTVAGMAALMVGPGEGWVALGDMRELGSREVELHAEVGRRARELGITRLYTVGQRAALAGEAYGEGARHFQDRETLAQALANDLRTGVRVLVKGSRSSGMERVVIDVLEAKGLRYLEGDPHAA